MEYTTYKIGDICRLKVGGDAPKDFSPIQTNEYPFPIFSNGLENEGLYGYSNQAKIQGDTITVSARGVNIGTVFYRKNAFLPIVRLIALIPNENICAQYLYYYLRGAKLYGTGSAQPQITVPFLKNKKIRIIKSFEVQKRIADILAKYDELIEVNNQRIKKLEQTAEELYKEWFVRFRFPNYQNTEFENGIPKDWSIKKIDDCYKTTSGGTPSRQHPEYYENGKYKWVKTGELLDSLIIETEEKITEEAVKNSSAKIIPPCSLLCSMYAGVGKLGISVDEITCSQATCVFNPKTYLSNYYLFFFLKLNKTYLENISFGAAQQNISQDIIKRIRITVPSETITKHFDSKVTGIFNEVLLIKKQNQNLIKQRDLLLPRLMSGKLEV